jgi:Arc/MetJ-type ribon-helix-helix transcriptional regulator
MQPRAIRFGDKVTKEIESAVRQRGFASSSAFIRYAVEQELSVRKEDITGAEERLAGSVDQVRREIHRLARAQQALFAYVDTFAKTLLTCVPSLQPRRNNRQSQGLRSAMTAC